MPAPRAKAYSYLRMSTKAQLKGDSRRRQIAKSQAYAAKHNLDLVDYRLEDIGVSAFRGANVVEGVLGKFVEAAEAGKIETGSYLIVEALDRITREQIRPAVALFLRILDAGINIISTSEDRVYRTDNTDVYDIFIATVHLSRGHEESHLKAKRVSEAWAQKRADAKKEKLTKQCPKWLRLSTDGATFELISNRATIVRSLFEETAAGIGIFILTKRLNANRTPPFRDKIEDYSGSLGWHSSYVSKILNNRAALGDYQPHKMVNGKRVPDGEAVKGYFPAVVSDDLFYRAQLARRLRSSTGAGRKGIDSITFSVACVGADIANPLSSSKIKVSLQKGRHT